ncbi:hypothetical protein [Halosegnis longus]|uniref:hypothetical protein n=1 Tax=Halosegnis longus TaxID=2216012 RepID=UPI00129E745A|nr:hypothetical protein [Halosegnis longus]
MDDSDLVGEPVEYVTERVADRGDHDLDDVRAAIDPFVEDGRVTREGIDATVSDTAKIISTAESRVEYAEGAAETMRETLVDAPTVPTVETRRVSFEERLDAVCDRRDAVQATLASAVEQADSPSLFELGVDLRTASTHAQGIVQTADDLQNDIEQFESWLTDPDRRTRELGEDVELVGDAVEELETATEETPEPATLADVHLQTDVFELLVADIRAELDDLAAFEPPGDLDSLHGEVDALDDRLAALRARLDDAPSYREQFDDVLASLAESLADREPPVEWGAIQETLADHREQVRATRTDI